MKLVAPVTVPPVNDVDVLNPVTLNVPPVLLVNVAVPLEYVPPVTLISVGKFKYVVADIVVAVKLPWISVLPETCNDCVGLTTLIPILPVDVAPVNGSPAVVV